jgi:hypothetical protein
MSHARNCELCGKGFILGYAMKQRFCGKDCYKVYINTKNKGNYPARKVNMLIPQETIINAHNVKKPCAICNKEFITRTANQKICSKTCLGKRQRLYERHSKNGVKGEAIYKTRVSKCCVVCNTELSWDKNWQAKTCGSTLCDRTNHVRTTYKRLNNNWTNYLRTLCRLRHNAPERNKQFTHLELFELLEKQDYKCARTGVPLTCEVNTEIIVEGDFSKKSSGRKRKTIPTNVSIDRIDNSKWYTLDNVQLVCLIVNIARNNLEIDEYVDWCRKVVEHSDKQKEENEK